MAVKVLSQVGEAVIRAKAKAVTKKDAALLPRLVSRMGTICSSASWRMQMVPICWNK